ncbi:MAG: hypothetical protein NZM25_07650 [Leptospiraceae bacterium]|nr:hypothetical protein [Leptospiraceae bacterium]MDW8305473.1 hypothetical protein [Leptospiraceae bacterium]
MIRLYEGLASPLVWIFAALPSLVGFLYFKEALPLFAAFSALALFLLAAFVKPKTKASSAHKFVRPYPAHLKAILQNYSQAVQRENRYWQTLLANPYLQKEKEDFFLNDKRKFLEKLSEAAELYRIYERTYEKWLAACPKVHSWQSKKQREALCRLQKRLQQKYTLLEQMMERISLGDQDKKIDFPKIKAGRSWLR